MLLPGWEKRGLGAVLIVFLFLSLFSYFFLGLRLIVVCFTVKNYFAFKVIPYRVWQPKMTQHLSGRSFTFVNWNCNGVNNPVKRSKILQHLQHLGAHIVYLQDTHLKIQDHLLLRRRWVDGYYFTPNFRAKPGALLFLYTGQYLLCARMS